MFKNMLNYSDLKQAIKENKNIIIQQSTVSCFSICSIVGAIGCEQNRMELKQWGMTDWEMTGGFVIIKGVRVSVVINLEDKEFELREKIKNI